MEESKELQGFYKIFRSIIYVSILLEFFEYAIDPAMLDHWGGILCDIHGRIKRWVIYNDGNLAYSKLATFLLICITCIGTRNKKKLEFNARKQVLYPIIIGMGLVVLSVWLFGYPMETRLYTLRLNIWLYMLASIIGVVLVHIALDNISKFLKEGLLKDRFNFENESFEQCRELQENKYSVNIPMRYYYKGKFRKGWVNISNPFRGTWVVGTPGSGKTFSIIEPFIRQHSAKGFALVVYDYKFPTLATKLYYHYKKNQKLGNLPKGCKFNIINFVDVEYSRRVNPIQLKYINNLAAASETAETLLESLQKGKKEGGGGSDQFFQTSAVNFLAACIYFFCNWGKEPYDKDGNMLTAEKVQDKQTKRMIPTGRVFNSAGEEVEPAYWLGKYSDMPHILSFLNESYQTIFEVLETDNEVTPLLGPFQTALKNKAMEQLEGMIGTLRVYTSRLATKESYWIFHKDGDTAAEVIYERADAEKDFMGLTSWTGAMPKRTDAEVAKNYLSADELDTLNRIVSLYLDFAELQAKSHQPMYMKDWIQKLDDFLKLSGKELLTHAGRISAEIAKQKADMEYDKFKERTMYELSPVEIHFLENFEKEQKKLKE